jgi:hypothetical protein
MRFIIVFAWFATIVSARCVLKAVASVLEDLDQTGDADVVVV